MSPKLLVVDDEPQIRNLLKEFLSEHFEVSLAENGNQAIQSAHKIQPDLILMDIMMPGKNGIDACQELRADPATKHIPVLMLTAADAVDRRIEAFDMGADDFISKPFDFEELLSRLKSKYSRMVDSRKSQSSVIKSGNLLMNLSSHELSIDSELIKLSPLEFGILKALLENAGNVVTRKDLLKEVWNSESEKDRLIDAHFTSLRKKIKKYSGKVETVYGLGYKLT